MPKIMINNKPVNVAATTYMTGATTTNKGRAGMVPEPQAGDNYKVLKGNGTWEPIRREVAFSSTAASGTLTAAQCELLKNDRNAIINHNGTLCSFVDYTGNSQQYLGIFKSSGGVYQSKLFTVDVSTGSYTYERKDVDKLNTKTFTIPNSSYCTISEQSVVVNGGVCTILLLARMTKDLGGTSNVLLQLPAGMRPKGNCWIVAHIGALEGYGRAAIGTNGAILCSDYAKFLSGRSFCISASYPVA